MPYQYHPPRDPGDPNSPSGQGGATTGTGSPASGAPGLNVSPLGLTHLAKLFDDQGADLSEAAGETVKRLMAIGNFWGDDGAGRAFFEGDGGKAGYGAISADINAEVNALATTYARIGDCLAVMGRNVRLADWASIPNLPEVPE
jgi:hypothetical protein